jgi:hypothetical protein
MGNPVLRVRLMRTRRASAASTTRAQPPAPDAPVEWLDFFPPEDANTTGPAAASHAALNEITAFPISESTTVSETPAPARRWSLAAAVTIFIATIVITLVLFATTRPAEVLPTTTLGLPASTAVLRPTVRASPAVVNVAAGSLLHRDRLAIHAVLNRYRDALSVLDVAGVQRVWPGVNRDELRGSFSRLAEQNVEFEGCRISPDGTRATAWCAGVIESGFRRGSRRPNVARTQWEFELQKRSDRWLISAVDTLPR